VSVQLDSTEKSTKRKIFNNYILSNLIFFTLLLWGWSIPAAYFWYLAKFNDVVLPYLPRFIWLVPGELWLQAPLLYVILLFLLPLIFYFVLGKKQFSCRSIRVFFIVVVIIIAITHFIWGGTLYRNLF